MSLKDALLKAGFNSTKKENDRVPKRKKDQTKTQKHQFHRNFCEVCEAVHPDVERFKHRSPIIDGEWICLNCADKNEIHDQFRITNQSDVARAKRYRRFYGPTKDFSQEGRPATTQSSPNKAPRHQGNHGNKRPENRNPKKKNFNR